MNQISMKMNRLLSQMKRKKSNISDSIIINDNPTSATSTQLKRCLSTVDIILLGIGHMIGSGAYVLTSSIAKNVAGPAIIVSYLIAGFVAFLCALCYAEFSSRYPKCGSAYSYAYIALGEIWAFIVGWNMILENIIGIAAVSRASSAYLDSIIGGEIRNYTNSFLTSIIYPSSSTSSNVYHNNSHIDLMSGLIVIGFCIFLTSGMNITTMINNTFSIVNIMVIIIIIVVGGYYSDFTNWTNDNDAGGFMPYGWKGVFAGSASCFYAYIGFDSIATSGDEAKDPQRSIPLATFISMIIASLSYIGVSAVLTLMLPYNKISDESGLPDALGLYGANWAKYAVIIGACCGMATVMIGTIYSLTRIVYAMADDGLLFPWMSYINKKTQIPIMAMFFFTSFGIIMSIFMDITTLIEMMSIGTLIAYLVVSASIIVIRYDNRSFILIDSNERLSSKSNTGKDIEQQNEPNDQEQDRLLNNADADDDDDDGNDNHYHFALNPLNKLKLLIQTKLSSYFTQNNNIENESNNQSSSLISYCVLFIVILSILFCFVCKLYQKNINETLLTFALIAIIISLSVIIMIINMHKQNDEIKLLRYKVPMVPYVPILSIFFNVSLIINLNWLTWLRFFIWMIIGFSIYFLYGIKSSKAEYNDELRQKINDHNSSSGGERIKKWNSFDSTSQNEDILMARE